jgi:hypothetical protein
MKFAGIFGITAGILILMQWLFFLISAQVPELESAPLEIVFHLAAEFMTAVVIIAAGTAVLQRKPWAPRVYYLASGMLIYTVINSAGYFMQLGEWLPVVMFALLLLLSVVSVGKVVRMAKA